MTVHDKYYIEPQTPLTTANLNKLLPIECYDEQANRYSIEMDCLKKIFNIKQEVQGTGGRASKQPIDFNLYRRRGDCPLKRLTNEQIESLMRSELKL